MVADQERGLSGDDMGRARHLPFLLDTFLHSYSQILFNRSRWVGALLCAATAASPKLLLAGGLSILLSTAFALALRLSPDLIRAGLYGFNALLLGLGTWAILEPGIPTLLLSCSAVLAGVVVTASFQAALGRIYDLPSLTLPFLFVFFMVLGAAPVIGISSIPLYEIFNDSIGGLPQSVVTFFQSLGAIFFLPRVDVGVVVFFAFLFYSRIGVMLAIISFTIIYAATPHLTGGGGVMLPLALGYNCILTAIALGGVWFVPSLSSFLFAILGALTCGLISLGMVSMLQVVSIPLLILPFNATVLLMLYAMRQRVLDKGPKSVDFLMGTPEENLTYYQTRLSRFGARYFIPFNAPFKGRWTCTQGIDGKYTHKGLWRHAFDFEVLGAEGKSYRGEGLSLEDYHCYHLPVLAPADGTVVKIVDGIPDNPVGEPNRNENWGNLVIIHHGIGIYSMLCHLSPYTIMCRNGATVRAGEQVGLCGSSGRSPMPHLHFHLQGTPRQGAPTIDLELRNVVQCGKQEEYLSMFAPGEGDIVRNIEPNPDIRRMFRFQTGRSMTFVSTGTEETVVPEIDLYGNLLFRSSDRDAVMYYEIDDNSFTVYDSIGTGDSVLHLLHAGLSRVPFEIGNNLEWIDYLPLRHHLPVVVRPLIDIISPFLSRAGIRVRYKMQQADGNLTVTGTSIRRDKQDNPIVQTRTEISEKTGITLVEMTSRGKTRLFTLSEKGKKDAMTKEPSTLIRQDRSGDACKKKWSRGISLGLYFCLLVAMGSGMAQSLNGPVKVVQTALPADSLFNYIEPAGVETPALGEAVDRTDLTWTTGGDAAWISQSAVAMFGGDAAQSGTISHGQSSWIETRMAGPVRCSFSWKASSESIYDVLVLTVDGTEYARISGDVGWAGKAIFLSVGTHTLRWTYKKDAQDSANADAVWLDKVEAATTQEWKAAAPNLISGSAMVCDSTRQRLVLFGGSSNYGYSPDTWEWSGTAWARKADSGPAARYDHAMAFDSDRGKTVLFGGYSSMTGYLRDTWEWDGTTWKRVAVNGPSVGSGRMVYDRTRKRVVLLESETSFTWEWNGSTWTRVASTGPDARWFHAMAYDATRKVTVLFGGGRNGAYMGDTWEWDGSVWRRLATTGPAARQNHTMTFDSTRNRVVLFGGVTDAGYPADTWEWNGSKWTQTTAAQANIYYDSPMAFDTRSGRVVAFNHYDWTTRQYDGSVWTQTANVIPAARWNHAMTYDATRDRTVLYGGYNDASAQENLRDTWTWNGTLWHLASETGPEARSYHDMAFDSTLGLVYLYGGRGWNLSQGTAILYDDTWTWNGSTWTRVSISGPGTRYFHSMVYDARDKRLVLFGGSNGLQLFGDTWLWNGTQWNKKTVALSPSARYGHRLAYDAERERTILFGGIDATGYVGDTWVWDGASWVKQNVAGPSSRAYHTMTWDSKNKRVLLFGGYNDSGYMTDTWAWNGTVWEQVAATGPLQRAGHAMAFDKLRERTLLFGGNYNYANDTWEFTSRPDSYVPEPDYTEPPSVPTKPGILPVLRVLLFPVSTESSGGTIRYMYVWSSSGSDAQVAHGPTESLEDALYEGENGSTFDQGETWTVTVTPYNAASEAGASASARFAIGAGGVAAPNMWVIR